MFSFKLSVLLGFAYQLSLNIGTNIEKSQQ